MAWTVAHQARQDQIDAAVAAMPATLSRAEYEAACAAIDISPWGGDESIPMIAREGQFSLDNDPDARYAIRQYLAHRRLAAITAERANRQHPAVAPEILCPNCGMMTAPSMLMAASLGTACPECYDALSG